MGATVIRPARASDATRISDIYNFYIKNTTATFEVEPVSAEDIMRRMQACAALSLPWLVAQTGNTVVGYCYATKWRERHAYRYSVEATVYVDRRRACCHVWYHAAE